MLVILASMFDPHAAACAAIWEEAGFDPRVITCHNVAQIGWRMRSSEPDDTRIVLDDKPVKANEIKGVLTRLPRVTPEELPFVDAVDRAYVAAEFQAFLAAVLTRMPCPVLNRPTPGCLTGPSGPPERWLKIAGAAGIGVFSPDRNVYAGGDREPPRERPVEVVHVVADKSFVPGGSVSKPKQTAARELAAAAEVPFLRVSFLAEVTEPLVVRADTWLDVSDPEIANAVAGRLNS